MGVRIENCNQKLVDFLKPLALLLCIGAWKNVTYNVGQRPSYK